MRVLVMAAFMLMVMVCPAAGATIVFNTSDSQFDAGVDSQGWWSSTRPNVDDNPNYITGEFWRNFFTFDLSALDLTREALVSATLELVRYTYRGDVSETIALFDVSTDAATLNNNSGTSAAIYNDLGTGTIYGSFVVLPYTSSSTATLTFLLNSAALVDIEAAAGGFFSIGGSLQTVAPGGLDEFLFGGSHSTGIQRLILETVAVPEPASLALLGVALLGAAARLRRRFIQG